MIVRACFLCKVYALVYPNFGDQQLLHEFEQEHRGHPVQTVNTTEVPDFKNGKKRVIATAPLIQ